mmetsp:Transcript_26416/g.99340  ORF Transcript_26416/g.99340 Transcript_26416/m.99340 type:complete len:435 (+) Transcript_26416:558-1862(+)
MQRTPRSAGALCPFSTSTAPSGWAAWCCWTRPLSFRCSWERCGRSWTRQRPKRLSPSLAATRRPSCGQSSRRTCWAGSSRRSGASLPQVPSPSRCQALRTGRTRRRTRRSLLRSCPWRNEWPGASTGAWRPRGRCGPPPAHSSTHLVATIPHACRHGRTHTHPRKQLTARARLCPASRRAPPLRAGPRRRSARPPQLQPAQTGAAKPAPQPPLRLRHRREARPLRPPGPPRWQRRPEPERQCPPPPRRASWSPLAPAGQASRHRRGGRARERGCPARPLDSPAARCSWGRPPGTATRQRRPPASAGAEGLDKPANAAASSSRSQPWRRPWTAGEAPPSHALARGSAPRPRTRRRRTNPWPSVAPASCAAAVASRRCGPASLCCPCRSPRQCRCPCRQTRGPGACASHSSRTEHPQNPQSTCGAQAAAQESPALP